MTVTEDTEKVPRAIASSTALDDSKVSFLDLPSELRNEIYRCCLSAPQQLAIKPEDTSHHLHKEAVLQAGFSLQPNLFQACQQVRDEAVTILYGENTFYISNVYKTGQTFCKQIGSNIRYLRNVATGVFIFDAPGL
ncbi:hypothetical protein Slin15195_G127970 [Septoria linicola]|uniref:2EXR domain-containing protein n=1 Tax=Septoria linicola TaxID=215465 RepID=A0A9Q9ESD2_9PEZI|nr:hypothetical protein Slin15195_G127970 [Septoria linicola]